MLIKHELVVENGKRGKFVYNISDLGIEVAETVIKIAREREGIQNSPPSHSTPGSGLLIESGRTQIGQNSIDSEVSDSSNTSRRQPLASATNRSESKGYALPPRGPGNHNTAQSMQIENYYATGTGISSALKISLPTFSFALWEPGSFSVRVIIDNREMKSQTERNFFGERLNAYSDIQAEVRPLGVGDTIWLAVHNTTGEEVVLGHVAERKRIDDLMSSIKDGRFHEQKYRLSRSGLKHVIYIVEEAPGVQVDSMLEAVQTAISSTQVVNEFFLKRTAGVEDTVRYLARLTRQLSQLYCKKTLHVIPDHAIDRKTYLHLLKHLQTTDPDTCYNISFAKFQSTCSKSGNLTVRDVYLRMLLTISGISWEKAIEIQKEFPTPQHLWKALYSEYKANGEQAARELIMKQCSKNTQVSRKKIGKALSSKIAEIWGPVLESTRAISSSSVE